MRIASLVIFFSGTLAALFFSKVLLSPSHFPKKRSWFWFLSALELAIPHLISQLWTIPFPGAPTVRIPTPVFYYWPLIVFFDWVYLNWFGGQGVKKAAWFVLPTISLMVVFLTHLGFYAFSYFVRY